MYSDIALQTEYSLLKPTCTLKEIEWHCKEAIDKQYDAICVPPLFVKKAKELTTGTAVNVVTVIGYPYGFNVIEAKLAEIILAIVEGVDELNMVINMTALKNNDWQYLAREITTIFPIVEKKQTVLKLMLDTSILTNEELIKCCDIYGATGVHFISLFSNIENNLPTIETVQLVRKHLADNVQIQLEGNFDKKTEMEAYVKAGVNRIEIK